MTVNNKNKNKLNNSNKIASHHFDKDKKQAFFNFQMNKTLMEQDNSSLIDQRHKPFDNFIIASQEKSTGYAKARDRITIDDLDVQPDIESNAKGDTEDTDRLTIDDLEVQPDIQEEATVSEEDIESAISEDIESNAKGDTEDTDRLTIDDLEVQPDIQEEATVSEEDIESAISEDIENINVIESKDKFTFLAEEEISEHPNEYYNENAFEDINQEDSDLTTTEDDSQTSHSLRDEMGKHSLKTDGNDSEFKEDLENKELLSQNLFSYEDDGQYDEEFNEISNKDKKITSSSEDSKTTEANPKALLQVKDEENLKQVLLYLDELFGNLPEMLIKDFAQSPYYDKYNRLLDKLEL